MWAEHYYAALAKTTGNDRRRVLERAFFFSAVAFLPSPALSASSSRSATPSVLGRKSSLKVAQMLMFDFWASSIGVKIGPP